MRHERPPRRGPRRRPGGRAHEAHSYYFCPACCRDAFVAAPEQYITSHRHAADAPAQGAPQIDDGMRLWCDSCSCCLSDAYPDVKAAMDAERAANARSEIEPGICEVAEAETPAV